MEELFSDLTIDTIGKISRELENTKGANPKALFNVKEKEVSAITLGHIKLPLIKTIVDPINKPIQKFYSTSSLILPYTPKERAIGRELGAIDCSRINTGSYNEFGVKNYTVQNLVEIARAFSIPSLYIKEELVKNIREFLGCV